MYMSSLIKERTRNERDAAIALERAMNGVKDNTMDTITNVKLGVKRASWYSSCFFDKYKDVCSELKAEDARFIKSILEIYKRKDIIADMLKMYIETELKRCNIFDAKTIRSIDVRLTKALTGYSGKKFTSAALANSLSIAIVNSFSFKNDVIMKINKYSIAIVTAASFYGKVQTAALAARKLRQLSPELYQNLYNNNMEMLYFLISEKIDKALINSTGLRGEDKFISIIKSLAN